MLLMLLLPGARKHLSFCLCKAGRKHNLTLNDKLVHVEGHSS
jgi:hypothetical protein